MKFVNCAFALLFIVACKDENASSSEDKTTDAGWNYRYVNVPDKKNGWKITILANSPWNYEDHNPWASIVAPHMLQYSGYGDVSPADKAAIFEDLHSNAYVYQSPSQVGTDIYVEKGEEEQFFEAISAMFHDYALDAEYFETIKTQISQNLQEAEAVKDSNYISEQLMSYALFETNNDVITAYDMTLDALEDLTLDDVEEWIDHVKALDGLMIGVAGAEKPETIEPYLDEVLAGFSKGEKGFEIPKLATPSKNIRIAFENPESEKTNIVWSARWPEVISSEEFLPFDFALVLLDGTHTKTRLASIREELRASYGFQSFLYSTDINNYQLGISGESDQEHQAEVLKRIADVNASMRSTPPSEDEFDAAKSNLTSYFDEAQKDENAMAYTMAVSLNPSYSDDWHTEQAIYENADIEEVTKAIAENYPDDGDWMQVIVTPDASDIEADCVITDWKAVATCFE